MPRVSKAPIEETPKMPLLDVALQVAVGDIVETNGDGGTTTEYFKGVVIFVDQHSFTVKRQDGENGSGYQSGWHIAKENTKAKLAFISKKQLKPGQHMCYGCFSEPGEFIIDGVYYCKTCMEKTPTCAHCHKITKKTAGKDHTPVCPECRKKYYASCKRCASDEAKEHIVDGYCKNCRTNYLFKCSLCNQWHSKDSKYKNPDDPKELFCLTCFNSLFYTCNYCGTPRKSKDHPPTKTVGGAMTCPVCIKTYFEPCCDCGLLCAKDNFSNLLKKKVCKKCGEGYKTEVWKRDAQEEEVLYVRSFLLSGTSDKIWAPPVVEAERFFNTYNADDLSLNDLVAMIGKVDKPIYLYGIKDRPQFTFSITPTLANILRGVLSEADSRTLQEFGTISTPVGLRNIRIEEHPSQQLAFGISKTFRTDHKEWLTEFIKKITIVSPEDRGKKPLVIKKARVRRPRITPNPIFIMDELPTSSTYPVE